MALHKSPKFESTEEECFYTETPKHVLFELLRDVYSLQTNTIDVMQGEWLVELKKLVEKEDICLVANGDVYLQNAFKSAQKLRIFRESEKERKAKMQAYYENNPQAL